MKARVIVYTKNHCGYCVRAKDLLDRKGINYEEINLHDDFAEINALKNRTGHMTLPQIFIDEKMIGGYQELAALEREGKLEALRK